MSDACVGPDGSIDLPSLPRRPRDSHKGHYGHALIIGGSRGMSGAIALSGMAALRTGAGLVTLAVPDCCLETVAAFSPCYMLVPLIDDQDGRIDRQSYDKIQAWLDRASCIAIGPGLGRSRGLQTLCRQLLRDATQPIIMDADALNNIAESGGFTTRQRSSLVITPHPGEWQRLGGGPASDREQQSTAAVESARQLGMTIVLKGHQTLVTDGSRNYINTSGTPAMATGGSGDILTGVICGLICQGLRPFEAAQLGVFVHGRAGERAERELGGHVVLPTDLIPFLSKELQSGGE